MRVKMNPSYTVLNLTLISLVEKAIGFEPIDREFKSLMGVWQRVTFS